MIAVIKTWGKQYEVRAGQIVKVEKLDGKKGDNISIYSLPLHFDFQIHHSQSYFVSWYYTKNFESEINVKYLFIQKVNISFRIKIFSFA